MGRPKIVLPKEQVQTLIIKYQQGISQSKLEKEFGISRSVISRILRENNVKVRDVKEANTTKIPDNVQDQIVYNYTILGQGLQTAGKSFGYSQKTVETLLKNRGVKLRTYIEAKDVQRKYHVDDNFFKRQSSDMAYILGFLAADGSISSKENGIFLELHQQDEEILKKIVSTVQLDRPLTYRINNSGTPCVKMSVWSSSWKKDLAVYGITPNKTFTLQPPVFLESCYNIDFIRGYFDGDGTIVVRPEKQQAEVNITGVSKNMIVWIRDTLATQYGISNPKLTTSLAPNQKTIIYKTAYFNLETLKRLYHVFYDHSSLRMERKFNKFNSFIKSHETPSP